uniref:Uncharacterized protein n=1 Tax=Panagrellus redivivus TaxID=6233 RepID=A0A7E4W0C7_PANRE
MNSGVTTFSLWVLLVAFITCLNFVPSEHKPLSDDYLELQPLMMKRFNFNFLRTWQPLTHAEPLRNADVNQRIYDGRSNEQAEAPRKMPLNNKHDRIRQRLLCIAALQRTKKCEET